MNERKPPSKLNDPTPHATEEVDQAIRAAEQGVKDRRRDLSDRQENIRSTYQGPTGRLRTRR